MATWNDLPIELRLMIFKVKRQLHFIERKHKLIELLKGRTVKIVETPNDTYIVILQVRQSDHSSQHISYT